MPDVHWGYGFPIGGVAGTDVEAGGVVSPGGVGFDISCGVRLLVSDLDRDRLAGRLPALMDALDRLVPRGLGGGGVWRLTGRDRLRRILTGGAVYAVERGHGVQRDLDRCEDGGAVADADPAQVSDHARARGLHQVGSLGSGNHFLEVQAVDRIYLPAVAAAFGLAVGRVCVMIHSGSRGLGHQVCSDHVKTMLAAMPGYGIHVPDRQLACAPVRSPEGQAYLGAMAAAANYGRANRQLLAEAARRAFEQATGDGGLELLYDISHNLAKLEHHEVDGRRRLLCVHRKGATRALPPGHPDLPRRPVRLGAAGARPRIHGHRLLRADRGGRRAGVLLHLSWRRPADEPAPGHPPHRRPGAAYPVGGGRHRGPAGLGTRPGRRSPVRLQGHRRGRHGLRTGRPGPPGRPARPARRREGLTRSIRQTSTVNRHRHSPPVWASTRSL